MQPSIGRIVHYTSYGTPGGEFPKACRAAVITEVKDRDTGFVSLCVLNPSGLFFNEGVLHGDGEDWVMPARSQPPVLCDGLDHPGGTWHWPART